MQKLRLLLLTILPALSVTASMDRQFGSPTEIPAGGQASVLLCATEPAPPGPARDDPASLDPSARWLNRRPANQFRTASLDFRAPVSTPIGLAILPADPPAATPVDGDLPTRSWQFQLRAAPEPRAPSFS